MRDLVCYAVCDLVCNVERDLLCNVARDQLHDLVHDTLCLPYDGVVQMWGFNQLAYVFSVFVCASVKYVHLTVMSCD